MLTFIKDHVKFAFHYLKKFIVIYFIWIVLHFVCSHLYSNYCVPYNWLGFLISPFVANMPHCQAFRWIIYNGGNVIVTMWITLGTWFSCKFLLYLNNVE